MVQVALALEARHMSKGHLDQDTLMSLQRDVSGSGGRRKKIEECDRYRDVIHLGTSNKTEGVGPLYYSTMATRVSGNVNKMERWVALL